MDKKYLINVDTGVVFNYDEHMAELPNMRDCNPDGEQYAAEIPEVTIPTNPLPTDTDDSGDEVTVELESLHWTKLSALVEGKGGNYTNKAEAIAFLRGE